MGGKCHTLVLKMPEAPEAALTRWKHDHQLPKNAKLRGFAYL